MNKHIFILLSVIIINNYTLCMKRPITEQTEQQIKRFKHNPFQNTPPITEKDIAQRPFIPIEIIGDAFINSFKDAFSPRVIIKGDVFFKDNVLFKDAQSIQIQIKIHSMCLINHAMKDYICSPHNIRTIIVNTSHLYPYRGVLANRLTLPAAKNYLQQSENLHTNINFLTHDQIKEFVHAGADVNYCCCANYSKYSYPVLIHIRHDYDKTKLLLELGADSTMTNGIGLVPSPFQYALCAEDINLIKLFLAYKPRLRYLKTAMKTKNDEIIALILQDKNIPIAELNQALATIIVQTFNLSHARLLLDAGADPAPALNMIVKFSKSYLHDHNLNSLALEMIDLLCSYGAYDDFLYFDALVNGAPQQLIDSLEKGHRVMTEKNE